LQNILKNHNDLPVVFLQENPLNVEQFHLCLQVYITGFPFVQLDKSLE